MKSFNIYLLLSLVVLALGACRKAGKDDGPIYINFVNLTGASITQAKANDLVLGDVAVSGETGFRPFESFGTDTGMPDCNYTGRWNNRDLKSSSQFYWCGTEKAPLKPGRYTIGIKIIVLSGEPYFDLQFR